MPKDYISTDALHGLDYLAHARVYSHKYIRREPDGHGGYRYWYKTDVSSGSGRTYNNYANDRGAAWVSKNTNFNNSYMLFGPRHKGSNGVHYQEARDTNYMRNANKASEIYREGLPNDMPRGKKNTGIKEKVNSKMPANRPTNVSKEYLEELESNSRKNNFNFDNVTTWDNANIRSWDNSSSSSNKPNVAQQTISTITTVARNTYEAGVNFLKTLFSTPIITTKKNIDVHVVGNMR